MNSYRENAVPSVGDRARALRGTCQTFAPASKTTNRMPTGLCQRLYFLVSEVPESVNPRADRGRGEAATSPNRRSVH